MFQENDLPDSLREGDLADLCTQALALREQAQILCQVATAARQRARATVRRCIEWRHRHAAPSTCDD
jgi:hypothetical protein